jgi:hypothetical protein
MTQLANWMRKNGVRQLRLREGQTGFSVQLIDQSMIGVGDTPDAALAHANELLARWYASRGLTAPAALKVAA